MNCTIYQFYNKSTNVNTLSKIVCYFYKIWTFYMSYSNVLSQKTKVISTPIKKYVLDRHFLCFIGKADISLYLLQSIGMIF